jgi:hypothetical protein
MVHAMLAAAGGGLHVDTGVILAVIAIVAFLVTAAGVVGTAFRVGHNTQTVANYRETAQSWKEKADAQEAQLAELEHRSTEKDGQIAELQAKVGLLEKLVLGESTALGLRADHQAMDKKVTATYDAVHGVQQDVTAILARLPA